MLKINKNIGKKLLSTFFALAMVIGLASTEMLSTSATVTETDQLTTVNTTTSPTGEENNGLETNKTVVQNIDGSFTLNL